MQLSDNQRKGLIIVFIVLALGLITFGVIKLTKKPKREEIEEYGMGEGSSAGDEIDLAKPVDMSTVINKGKEKTDINQKEGEEVNFTGKKTSFPLKHGVTGKEVEQLQLWLFKNEGIQTFRNGVFDEITEKAVAKAFENNQVTEETFKKCRMDSFKTYQH